MGDNLTPHFGTAARSIDAIRGKACISSNKANNLRLPNEPRSWYGFPRIMATWRKWGLMLDKNGLRLAVAAVTGHIVQKRCCASWAAS